MPALFVNLKIDSQEKFEFLKVTIGDLSGLFEECHVKIRGVYSRECVDFIRDRLGSSVRFYQELREDDWVAATLLMLQQIESRSVFLYFEDHKLVADRQQLKQTLADFDNFKLDHLCYSFFRASQLDVNNLLPLGATPRQNFHEFWLSIQNLGLIGKLSPGYYTFSLVSIVSVKYFKEILLAENKKFKIFGSKLTSIVTRLFSYPRYRAVVMKINRLLSLLDARLCIYPPSSPFNLEKIWFESSVPVNAGWKLGVLTQELFANYDDDNGAYGESLIKRGLYPFEPHSFNSDAVGSGSGVARHIKLGAGESFDCTYYSHIGRIRCAPRVQVSVVRGAATVQYCRESVSLSAGEIKLFYSNFGPMIRCVEACEVQLLVIDEAFEC